MKFAILLLGAALAGRAQLCSVEGQVLNDATGKPVAKATVLLHGASNSEFYTQTDEKGQYGFAGIEPGSYTLTAERAGFVTATYGAVRPQLPGKMVALKASQKASGLDMRMIPGGAIAGKVLYADGQPAFGASLTLLRAKYVDGQKQLMDVGSSMLVQSRRLPLTTNDLGEFRVPSLEPGHYYVRADAGRTSAIDIGMVSAQLAGPVTDTAPTYYPSTIDRKNAEAIEVSSGRTTGDVTITLVETPVGTIRGHVENAPTASRNSFRVILYSQYGQSFGLTMNPQTGELEAQGAVPPGRYTAVAFITAGAAGLNPGGARYDLIPVDVNGGALSITLHASTSLAGVLKVQDGRPADLHQVRVALRPSGFVRGMPDVFQPAQPVAADGKFTFAAIFADRYAVQVLGLPEGVYVQSIHAGDADVLENGLDLTAAAAGSVEIVLSRKTGTVEGLVTDAQGRPVNGAMVALVPIKGREYRTAFTDEGGKFTVKSAPPGEYRAFAWADVEDGAWTDAEFLKPILGKARMVTVREGATERLELSAIR